MSGLTTATGTTNHTHSIWSNAAEVGNGGGRHSMTESEAKDQPRYCVGEYRDPPKERAEAAQHVLSTLQAHMRVRNKSDTCISEEPTHMTRKNFLRVPTPARDLHGENRLYSKAAVPFLPGTRGTKYSKKVQLSRRHKSAKQIMEELDEPLSFPTRLDSNMLNLPIGYGVSPVEERGQHIRTGKTKLLADPNINAMIDEWSCSESRQSVSTGMTGMKFLVDPNRYAMVGGSKWDPIPLDLSMSTDSRDSRVRVEPREDRQLRVRPVDNYAREGRQDNSQYWLYKDQRSESRVLPVDQGTNGPHLLVVERGPSSGDVVRSLTDPPRMQESFSETKSVSSCLSKYTGIPRRSKSVSFNLPDDGDGDDDDDDDEVVVNPFKSGGSVNSSSSRCAQVLAQRSAIARKELARLSQRQAAEIANGNNLARIPILAR
jgi:hypothetical protein